jgi:hypothetical protein
LIPACRNVFLLLSIGSLLLSLSVATGCCKRCCGPEGKAAQADNSAETGSVGVTVTSPVPHAGTTGAATDNAAAAPSPLSVPREIPIGKKPPPKVIPPGEGTR